MKRQYLAVLASLAIGAFAQHPAHATMPIDPRYDVLECYLDAGPGGAIDWSKKNDRAPLIARVRHLNDKRKPDHCAPPEAVRRL